jgi:hypothetical protein
MESKNMFINRKKIILFLVVLLSLPVAAFAGVTKDEKEQSDRILSVFRQAQPVPERPWSQLRQSLIEIEVAQMDTTVTTSFFFNTGIKDPIDVCPSIGFAIPASYQLTNPFRTAGSSDNVAVGQLEANGVYTAGSTGTYVMCVVGKGLNASYWEGFVKTEVGIAHWDSSLGRIVRDSKQGLMSNGKK